MGIKRVVDVDFWNDDKVLEMFSPEDKLFMVYLLTNPHTTQLGIYSINVRHMAFELGYSIDTVKVLLERFQDKYNIIKYDYGTKEIAVKNYLVYSIIKGGAPVRDCLIKELKHVKNKKLIEYVFGNIKGNDLLNATVQNLIKEYEEANGEIMFTNEKENKNENENENENDVSYHDTYHDTLDDTLKDVKPKKSTKKFTPPTLEEITAYCNSRQSSVNPKTFYEYFSEGNWVDAKGNKVKNWKQKIITWENHNSSKPQSTSTNKGASFADLLKTNQKENIIDAEYEVL